MRRLGLTAAALSIVVLLALAGASFASAASPWWRLTLGSRPTTIQPGSAKDEQQELAVHATEGSLLIVSPKLTPKQIEEFEVVAGETYVEVPFNAPPAVLQEKLETLYGAGNVNVTGGPGGETGTPYVITFVGALADQAAEPIRTYTSFLSGGQATAGVSCTGFQPGFGVGCAVEKAKGAADGEVVLTAENLGDASVNGAQSPVLLSDVLPAGVRPIAVSANEPEFGGPLQNRIFSPCSLEAQRASCTLSSVLPPYQSVEMRIAVIAQPEAAGSSEASVSGGEAPTARATRPLSIAGAVSPFGIEDYSLTNEQQGGGLDTQAGSHPFQQTTTLDLNQTADTAALTERPRVSPAGLPKDLSFVWPPGLVGNPSAVPSCTLGQFTTKVNQFETNACPPQAAVGVAAVLVRDPTLRGFGTLSFTVPLFNLEPAVGEPARFGFFVPLADVPVVIDTSVRTGGDYGVTVSVSNVSQAADFISSQVTVWGTPGDPRHDSARGWGCLAQSLGRREDKHEPCAASSTGQVPAPFLTLPTSCTGELSTSVNADSWAQAGSFQNFPGEAMPALDGCNRLPFAASIRVAADGQAASTPTGLTVDVHVPQEVSQNPEGLANSNVKDIAVTLPPEFVLNPAAADGLQACSEAQIGFTGVDSAGASHFTSGDPSCPDASKVATAQIRTPLLPNPLTGAVYLATPAPEHEAGRNPFNSLVAMYIVAKDPVSGTLVKLPGKVTLDPVTGQISSTFEHNPQLPFEDAELHFFGGDRAPLATPAHCGPKTTQASFTPWSANPPIGSSSTLSIASGPNGTPCLATLPFAPTLAAGTTNINAASFSPLSTTISRADGNQDIKTVQLHMPPGLSGILKGVPLCPEAQASAGTCSQESEIGKTIVSVGLGGDPFSVTGGQVFLTEKYKGAPFGLSIVNPAVAGPFDLGKVIVRAKIEVDPSTAALTITTDEIPHILKGIPLQIKHVNVTIDRPGFTFNPTNCSPQQITGTIGSVEGASSPVAVPFQVTNCASLKFAPKFQVSTAGATSKVKGASLTVKLSYPNAPQGTQANITRVKVDLPRQLPSQLKTLQQACIAKVFETNPAACPAASIVGHATVHTPLLPVPLVGPAYFVSHGGESFPSLTMVLQGYGVTVQLVGSTFIKNGITSSTFKTVPDVPFNTFELTLPQGKYAALAAYVPGGNGTTLCGQHLKMPTEFLAQNGAKINQSTPIAITGCGKPHHKHASHRRKHAAKRK